MAGDDLTGVELQLRQVREKFTEQQKSLSVADLEALATLVGDLQKVVSEMDQILQRNSKQMNVSFLLNHESSVNANGSVHTVNKNGIGNNGQAAVNLDRAAFYAESSPFQHQMDRSGSFRLCPPMAHTTAADYFSNDTQAPLLISDGQILENLANLKRLGEMQNR
ncbi:unnamed protein product [Kluyveromyces dobzhanskii CBS 2104]|uniref:WGS project CCBQ000000000 data, contig 00008 n=1 Tax=Kluyveromyces dobzhanskii CBS 2104 TaxID=1427455 RepID=A0A0A8L722_9SACH|nr:unnamed protein product [Kluyveromyces dobzhanskii CBS 2104]